MSAGARPLREKAREGGAWSAPEASAAATFVRPPQPEADLVEQLGDLRDRATRDPFTNPIRLLALDLARQLDGPLAGEALDRLIQRLTVNAAASRASHLRRYLGELDPTANVVQRRPDRRADIALPQDGQGGTLPFTTFRARVERSCYGFVVTAHPTFSLSRDLRNDLMALVLTPENGRTGRGAELVARLAAVPHVPTPASTSLSSTASRSTCCATCRRRYATSAASCSRWRPSFIPGSGAGAVLGPRREPDDPVLSRRDLRERVLRGGEAVQHAGDRHTPATRHCWAPTARTSSIPRAHAR